MSPDHRGVKVDGAREVDASGPATRRFLGVLALAVSLVVLSAVAWHLLAGLEDEREATPVEVAGSPQQFDTHAAISGQRTAEPIDDRAAVQLHAGSRGDQAPRVVVTVRFVHEISGEPISGLRFSWRDDGESAMRAAQSAVLNIDPRELDRLTVTPAVATIHMGTSGRADARGIAEIEPEGQTLILAALTPDHRAWAVVPIHGSGGHGAPITTARDIPVSSNRCVNVQVVDTLTGAGSPGIPVALEWSLETPGGRRIVRRTPLGETNGTGHVDFCDVPGLAQINPGGGESPSALVVDLPGGPRFPVTALEDIQRDVPVRLPVSAAALRRGARCELVDLDGQAIAGLDGTVAVRGGDALPWTWTLRDGVARLDWLASADPFAVTIRDSGGRTIATWEGPLPGPQGGPLRVTSDVHSVVTARILDVRGAPLDVGSELRAVTDRGRSFGMICTADGHVRFLTETREREVELRTADAAFTVDVTSERATSFRLGTLRLLEAGTTLLRLRFWCDGREIAIQGRAPIRATYADGTRAQLEIGSSEVRLIGSGNRIGQTAQVHFESPGFAPIDRTLLCDGSTQKLDLSRVTEFQARFRLPTGLPRHLLRFSLVSEDGTTTPLLEGQPDAEGLTAVHWHDVGDRSRRVEVWSAAPAHRIGTVELPSDLGAPPVFDVSQEPWKHVVARIEVEAGRGPAPPKQNLFYLAPWRDGEARLHVSRLPALAELVVLEGANYLVFGTRTSGRRLPLGQQSNVDISLRPLSRVVPLGTPVPTVDLVCETDACRLGASVIYWQQNAAGSVGSLETSILDLLGDDQWTRMGLHFPFGYGVRAPGLQVSPSNVQPPHVADVPVRASR